MSQSSLEVVVRWAGILTVLCTAVAALSGCILWYFSEQLSKKKEIEFKKFQEESGAAIAAADERAAKAFERAEVLELEVARQREKAAIAERDLLEVRQRLHGRHLTAFQRRMMVHELQKYPGVSVNLVVSPADPEAMDIAGTIEAALREAEWKVRVEERDLTPSIEDILVEVDPKADETTLRAASTLRGDLHASHIPVEFKENPKLGKKAGIRVTIGKKAE